MGLTQVNTSSHLGQSHHVGWNIYISFSGRRSEFESAGARSTELPNLRSKREILQNFLRTLGLLRP